MDFLNQILQILHAKVKVKRSRQTTLNLSCNIIQQKEREGPVMTDFFQSKVRLKKERFYTQRLLQVGIWYQGNISVFDPFSKMVLWIVYKIVK